MWKLLYMFCAHLVGTLQRSFKEAPWPQAETNTGRSSLNSQACTNNDRVLVGEVLGSARFFLSFLLTFHFQKNKKGTHSILAYNDSYHHISFISFCMSKYVGNVTSYYPHIIHACGFRPTAWYGLTTHHTLCSRIPMEHMIEICGEDVCYSNQIPL